MNILVIDSCIRKESKTKILLNNFIETLNLNSIDLNIKTIILNNNKDLMPLNDELLKQRDSDCYNKAFDSSYYNFAKELKECDILVVAAPFYDLCFPAILKTFIEQTLIYNLTFVDTGMGVEGIIKCKKLIYLSVRGLPTNDENNIDIAIPYLKGYCKMLGIKDFYSLVYEGIDYSQLNEKLEADIIPFYNNCLNNN